MTAPQNLLALAIAAQTAGRSAEALGLFEKALAEGAPSEECQLQIAHALQGMRRFDDAVTRYREVLQSKPQNVAARVGLARSLDKLNRWAEAVEEFRAALRLDASRTDVKLALGVCLLRLERATEALPVFESRLGEDPEDRIALLGKSIALHQTGRRDEAGEIYDWLVAREPAMAQVFATFGVRNVPSSPPEPQERTARWSPAVLHGLIAASFAEGDHESAEQYCVELTALAPDSYEAWFNLAVARHCLSRMSEAAVACERAIQLRPGSAQAQLGLAVLRHASGDLAGASDCYEKALQLDRDSETALWNLGLLREQQRDPRAAEQLYRRLVEVNQSSADAWFRLGFTRLECGEFLGSVAAYETCLRLRGSWPEASYNLGLAYWRLGKRDLVRGRLEAALDAPSTGEAARRALASLAIDNRDNAEALAWHLELVRHGDRSADVRYNTALLRHLSGNLAAAIDLYEQVLEIDPNCVDALVNLCAAQKATGDFHRASISWERALRLRPEVADEYFDRFGWFEQQAGSPSA